MIFIHPVASKEKECLLTAEKRSIFLQSLQDSRALSYKLSLIAARILFNCQRAIMSEKGRHSIALCRSIESP